jgi:hypothetical protein
MNNKWQEIRSIAIAFFMFFTICFIIYCLYNLFQADISKIRKVERLEHRFYINDHYKFSQNQDETTKE